MFIDQAITVGYEAYAQIRIMAYKSDSVESLNPKDDFQFVFSYQVLLAALL